MVQTRSKHAETTIDTIENDTMKSTAMNANTIEINNVVIDTTVETELSYKWDEKELLTIEQHIEHHSKMLSFLEKLKKMALLD